MRGVWPEAPPALRRAGFADKACPVCGWRFFTVSGLSEHGVCRPLPPDRSAALRETGRRVAALNNAVRRRCDVCGLESTAPGVGLHQKHTGHTGWTAVS